MSIICLDLLEKLLDILKCSSEEGVFDRLVIGIVVMLKLGQRHPSSLLDFALVLDIDILSHCVHKNARNIDVRSTILEFYLLSEPQNPDEFRFDS